LARESVGMATDDFSDPHNLQPDDQPEIEPEEFGVGGMASAEHARKIEETLRGQPGVQEVRADLARGVVVVKFDARRTHVPDLHDALGRAGYAPSAEPQR